MFVRRVFIPAALILTLLIQFLPGGVFAGQPVAAAVCDIGQFLADMTIPDGTTMAAGQVFDKTWRVKNVGTCTWTTAYKAVFVSGSQMSAPAEVNLASSVAPGGTIDITIRMTAPTAPGRYIGHWKLKNASGGVFGLGGSAAYSFFVDIRVAASYSAAFDFVAHAGSAEWKSGAGALTFDGPDGDIQGHAGTVSSPQLENGSIDSNPGLLTVPQHVAGGYIQGKFPAFTVQAGDRFQSIINCAYNAVNCYVTFRLDYQVGSTVRTLWRFNERYEGLFYRANIDLSSLAGQSVQFILYVQDVSGRGVPSGDRALWGSPKIVRTGSGPAVTAGPSPTFNPATCTNRGEFVTDVTIPDGSTLNAGQAFTKTWRIKNVGTCAWTSAYSLVFVYGDALGADPVQNLTSSVAPGETADFSVNMVAPAAPGSYRSYWRFKNAGGAQFGVGTGMVTFFADIKVSGSVSGTAYDFYDRACEATWTSGAGALPCPGTDGDARGFVLKLSAPKLEDGSTGSPGLLTFPQGITDGYIQGVYPAFTVQSGDRFQSVVNCQYGATGCYVTFQLNYRIDSGPVQTLKTFREKIDGMYYRMDVDLSSLAGRNVNFILKVLATGSPAGDRAVWSGPRIARLGGALPTPIVPTVVPTEVPGTMEIFVFNEVASIVTVTRPFPVDGHPELDIVEASLYYLFQGLTETEQALGLEVPLNGTTGYSEFRIDGNGAHVYLTGTCNSGGATYTIANLIRVNLKNFSGIQFVKIYDQTGNTGVPDGASDSIPACLEP